LGPASELNAHGSSVKTQKTWVLCQDPKDMGPDPRLGRHES